MITRDGASLLRRLFYLTALTLVLLGCQGSTRDAESASDAGAPAGASGSAATPANGGAAPAAGGGGDTSVAGAPDAGHLQVAGSDLTAWCGEKVLLRGVNQMTVWFDQRASSYAEIARTGANSVRIVWLASSGTEGLEAILSEAETRGLIPILEMHDATGDFSKLETVVQFWLSAPVVALVKKHERWLMLNVANECGGGSVLDATYTSVYASAVQRLRAVGVQVPIVLDASNWSQNIEQSLRVAPALLAADPLKNLVFSWHEYSGSATEAARITRVFEQSKAAGVVLIVGEFASAHSGDCKASVPYLHLIAEAQRVGIGWLPWSWDTGNEDCRVGNDSVFDMTTDRTLAGLKDGWAKQVVLTDPNSIQNTSVRPCVGR